MTPVPFRQLPEPWPRVLRTVLGVAWMLVILMGLTAVILTPRTIEGALGSTLTYTWASIAVLGGCGALYGVARNQYRVEWIYAWIAASGASAYTATVLFLVFHETPTRATQACVSGIALVFIAYRALELSAHAARMRAMHSGSVRA